MKTIAALLPSAAAAARKDLAMCAATSTPLSGTPSAQGGQEGSPDEGQELFPDEAVMVFGNNGAQEHRPVPVNPLHYP